ncbi:MAG: FHA domain-containing protein [Bacteroidales bacterium]|nr:FHA domain-containing protein [Bacteroidales bacterium]
MEKVKITCPYCKQVFAIKKPEKSGNYRIVCPNPNCKKDIRLKLVAHPIQMQGQGSAPVQPENEPKDTAQTPPTKIKMGEEFRLHKARLIQQRKFKSNIVHQLSEGRNLIGRKDDVNSSDISIEGDNTISRQSVEIIMERTEKGYLFKLNVLRAKNPVYLNKAQLTEGEGMYLDYGDIIRLGKTSFIFEECKN